MNSSKMQKNVVKIIKFIRKGISIAVQEWGEMGKKEKHLLPPCWKWE
jgi:hypothetical protein